MPSRVFSFEEKHTYHRAAVAAGSLTQPERLEQSQFACVSGVRYWAIRGLDSSADFDDFERITRRIKEQAYQQSVNKAVQDGQRIIDQVTANATDSYAEQPTTCQPTSSQCRPGAIPALPS
jgi:hypothetical protein